MKTNQPRIHDAELKIRLSKELKEKVKKALGSTTISTFVRMCLTHKAEGKFITFE